MKLLNIACGTKYHKDWLNIDFHAHSKYVSQVNLLDGLPFKNNTIDAVYSSHFLEHLSVLEGKNLIHQINNVLKVGGIIRMVVPDLENVCREYLDILNNDNSINEKKYEWIIIELLDQLTRTETGGNMGNMFNQVKQEKNQYLADYILHRTGDDLLHEKQQIKTTITFNRVKNKLMRIYLKLVQLLIPKNIRKMVFINTSIGEKHKWMYDKYSLSKLLKEAGFKDVIIQTYNTSQISDFNTYCLDCNKDSTPYKGVHSLYIEATK